MIHRTNTTDPLCKFPQISHCFILSMDKAALLMKLGARIRQLRNDKGITQAQLAHAIGKDQQSVQRLEAGRINPSYYYLHEIAAGLGVPLAELLQTEQA